MIWFYISSVLGTDFDNEDKFRVFRLVGGNWTQLTEMNWTNRYGHSCQLVQNEKLVVLGGYEHNHRVDIFDLATLTWSKVSSSLENENEVECFRDQVCQ